MPIGAQGARFRAYWKEESVEGTPPAGNWDQFPCFSLDLDAKPGLQADSILSSNIRRNAADPYQSVAGVEGTAVVPIDTVHFGKWLNQLLGDPTTTGAGPYVHVFKSGGSTLPTRSIEKAFTGISRYEVSDGVRVNSMEVGIGPDGAAQASFGLLCLNSVNSGSSSAGTPVVTAYTRFHQTQGSITYGGSALAGVTAGTFRFSNGMQPVPTVGSGLGIGGIDFGECTGGGSFTARFASHALEDAARALTAAELSFTLTIDSNTLVDFQFPRVFLEPTSVAVAGPGGISRNYNFIAADDAATVCLLKVTYKNAVASYA